MTRLINPWRKYSLSKVWHWILSPILPSFAAMHKHPGDVAGSRELHGRHPVLNCIPALSARFALYSDAGLKIASESLQPAGLVSVLGLYHSASMQEKLARDKNHENIRNIYKELVDEC